MALGALANIARIPELRRRLLFSLGMIAVYRVGVYVTVPGVDRKAMQEFIGQDGGGSFLNLLNLFSGGALEQFSIFALGVTPYVSASIILQLLTSIFKPLEELRKEGEIGQRKINQYTRYAAVVLALVQAFGIATFLESKQTSDLVSIVRDPGWGFRLIAMLTLATGTAFESGVSDRGINCAAKTFFRLDFMDQSTPRKIEPPPLRLYRAPSSRSPVRKIGRSEGPFDAYARR